MEFKIGEAVVHPARGAGIVAGIEERSYHETPERYYRIALMNDPSSQLLLPVAKAEEVGLRRAVVGKGMDEVWDTLNAQPEALPVEAKARNAQMQEKLQTGDVIQVAEVVRDMTWNQREAGRSGNRIYEEGMALLSGEIAAVEGIGLPEAQTKVREALKDDEDEDGKQG
jgi:CarD family transcriptional regulator